MAGAVDSFDPSSRVLHMGGKRLDVSPGVATDLLIPRQLVTVSGHRSAYEFGPWVVTEIERRGLRF